MKPFVAKISVSFVLAFVLALGGCQTKGVKIPTAENLTDFGPPVTLNAKLRIPENTGLRPAVVLMHGCAGWHGSNVVDWSDWFLERGWVTLTIDSFGTRRVENICRGGKPHPEQRALDAYGGLDFLASLAEVDQDRVIVMGFSHGGSTVSRAMDRWFVELYREKTAHRFAGGVAMYPGACNVEESVGPLLIITAELDDWTPARVCKTTLEFVNKDLLNINYRVIGGATHAFDLFSWKGKSVGPRYYLGHSLVPNRDATEEARRLVAEYLNKNFAR